MLNRRSLMLSAASLKLLGAEALAALPPSPARTRSQLGARQALVPIGFRGRGANGSAAYYDNTSTTSMDQTAWWAPPVGQVTAIQLVYAAWDMPQSGEVDRQVTANLVASLSFPAVPAITVNSNAAQASGSGVETFQGTLLGVNGITQGAAVSSSGGGIASGTYVTSAPLASTPGGGNNPGTTTVNLSAPTTAATVGGQPYTFTGSIVPVTFNGARTLTIAPKHGDYRSDFIACSPAPGSQFFVRNFASFSASGLQLMDYPGVQSGPATRLAGEFSARGTAQTDQTLNPSVLSNTGGGYFCPVAMLALVTVPAGAPAPGAALILGDSIDAGTGDNSDGTYGCMGYMQRSLAAKGITFISVARGSTTAFAASVQERGQAALAVDSGITDVILGFGRNDIEIGRLPAAAVMNALATDAAPFLAARQRVWPRTDPPSTYSNDGYLSAVNQAFPVAVASTTATVTASASTTLAMASVANLAVGQLVCPSGSGTGTFSAGTTISSLGTASIVLSQPLAAALPASSVLCFGTPTASASPVEVQRLARNASLLGSYTSYGYAGVIDLNSVASDATGRWVTPSVSGTLVAGTIDGVHPSPTMHQLAVNAGIVPVSNIVS
jgi:lysophospholipase L1-like esterase